MAKKLTVKVLAEELEGLRDRVLDVEKNIEQTVGHAADSAVRKVREFVGAEPVSAETRNRLIHEIAYLKSQRRADDCPLSHWLEAEEEVDHMLRSLGLWP